MREPFIEWHSTDRLSLSKSQVNSKKNLSLAEASKKICRKRKSSESQREVAQKEANYDENSRYRGNILRLH